MSTHPSHLKSQGLSLGRGLLGRPLHGAIQTTASPSPVSCAQSASGGSSRISSEGSFSHDFPPKHPELKMLGIVPGRDLSACQVCDLPVNSGPFLEAASFVPCLVGTRVGRCGLLALGRN